MAATETRSTAGWSGEMTHLSVIYVDRVGEASGLNGITESLRALFFLQRLCPVRVHCFTVSNTIVHVNAVYLT